MNSGEDRGVRSDAQRQRKHSDGAEDGRLPKEAGAVTDIGDKGVGHSIDTVAARKGYATSVTEA